MEYGLFRENWATYSTMSHAALKEMIQEILQRLPDAGEAIVIGALRARTFTKWFNKINKLAVNTRKNRLDR